MIFEWDDDKAAANLRKHHVPFELAELVWDDRAHIVVFDRYEDDEERWHAIGLVRGILILTVVHTHATPDNETACALSAPEKRLPMKGSGMKRKMTEADLTAQIARLVAMPDSAIDTVDIPEAPAENWALALRPGLYKPLKKPVTLRLDADVIDWFKGHTVSGKYQTEINRVLRRYVQDSAAQG